MHIIPAPTSLSRAGSDFRFTSDTVISCAPELRHEAHMLAGWLRPAMGHALPVTESARERDAVIFALDESLAPEAYTLDVSADRVSIRSRDGAGAFYAAQTLRQLLPSAILTGQPIERLDWRVPGAHIEDAPRFGWRGSHLDVSRHFFPVWFIKKHLDMMAFHKLNVFHWHLTDDQGWRIEIRKYPRLTEVGAWRKESRLGHERDARDLFDGVPHGGFYTQDEVRDIVAYAAARHIRVLPEIDVPGHMEAAIAAYPHLGNTDEPAEVRTRWGISTRILNVSDETLAFAEDVLSEVLELFPSTHIHIGGDECPRDEWRASPKMQALMRERGLRNEDELQSYFTKRLDAFLSKRGRVLVGWDEILEGGVSDNAVVMSWRGEQGGIHAAKSGHNVVMTPTKATYFDYHQTRDIANEPLGIGNLVSLEDVYAYEPVPRELSAREAERVLGTQCQLWTEYAATPDMAEYKLYPRLCAFAEVAWSPRGRRDLAEFYARLQTHQHRLTLLNVNHRHAPVPLQLRSAS